MIFVDMDIAQFYQLPKISNTRKNRQHTVPCMHLFTGLGLSEKKKKILLNLDQIENLDMTDLPLKERFNPFHMSVLNLSSIKADVEGTILLF